MGCLMHDTFVKTEEYRLAWLSEIEFAETAHVLKMLARELGQDTAPAIDELARRGLDAALAVLSGAVGWNVSDAYLRHRALWRVGRV
ncbi:hypothetical protein [Novosphingobium gossypii]|uniref:hypothetical protein n=1 Tax=Novosphingobium gossypii TaxID=1604774 RepID=UPI003D1A1138